MRTLKRIIFPSIILFLFLPVLSGCGLTETGNPCPGGDCPAAAGEEGDVYENDEYGVTVHYPEGWSIEEQADEIQDEPEPGEEPDMLPSMADSVTFTSGDTEVTWATIIISELDPAPASLADYLAQRYPGRTFEPYDTGTLIGFLYDDPVPGEEGGDSLEYFFLEDGILIHVVAEVFPSGEEAFEDLLAGISIW